MFAHSYRRLTNVLRWVNAICPAKKFSFEMAAETWWWRSEDSQNFSGHPYIGRIARSSLR